MSRNDRPSENRKRPGMAPGTDAGGIRTLERLRCRCRIDEISGCWLCGMCIDKGLARVAVANGDSTHSVVNGRRAALMLSGVKFGPGDVAYAVAECPSTNCVNPAHAAKGTPADAGRARAASGRAKGNVGVMRGATTSARKARKLTDDQVAEIRASRETGRVLAARYGVSPCAISLVRRFITYRPPGFSVFAHAPASNDDNGRKAA